MTPMPILRTWARELPSDPAERLKLVDKWLHPPPNEDGTVPEPKITVEQAAALLELRLL